jgi:hypothetical protein
MKENIDSVKYGFIRTNFESPFLVRTPDLVRRLREERENERSQFASVDQLKAKVCSFNDLPQYVQIKNENIDEKLRAAKTSNMENLVIEAVRTGKEYLKYIQKTPMFFNA